MVSVIIPNYNHAQYLDLRIQSVLNQTYGDFEVIILDDCSTDNSKQVIEQYKNHPKISLIIYNEVNSGSTFKQWQKGIAVAQGDWIWVAESDDYSASTFLSELTVLISKDESIGLAYCNSNRVDKDGEKVNVSTRSIYNDLLFSHKPHESWMEQGWKVFRDQLMVQCTIPNASAVLVRKDLIKLFIEESCYFKLTGDWILWSNISFQTTIAYHPLPLNFFRHHEGSVRAATGSVKLKVTEYGKIRTMFDLLIADLPVTTSDKNKIKAFNRKLKGVDLGYMSLEDVRNRKFVWASFKLIQSIYYWGFEKEFLFGFAYWFGKGFFSQSRLMILP